MKHFNAKARKNLSTYHGVSGEVLGHLLETQIQLASYISSGASPTSTLRPVYMIIHVFTNIVIHLYDIVQLFGALCPHNATP